ncbi:hypothetical protein WJX77_006734 [Trebouxia sp. C0004]
MVLAYPLKVLHCQQVTVREQSLTSNQKIVPHHSLTLLSRTLSTRLLHMAPVQLDLPVHQVGFSAVLDGFAAWKRKRVAPAVIGFQPAAVDPQPAGAGPQPAGIGPQLAAADPQPAFEVDHAIAETKEGPQWDSQATPWVPEQANTEVQQQQQQQADAKQQEEGGMKEGAGPFGKQGAGLLQQQQPNSPKIAAVKGGLDLLPDAGERAYSPSFSPHPPEGKPPGLIQSPHGGFPPFGPPPRAWGPPPSGPPPGAWGKSPSGPPPGAWGQPASDTPPGTWGQPPSDRPSAVWGQPPSALFHGPAPHAAVHSNMASGMSHQMAFPPQAATMQPAFAAPVFMQPEYMAPAHLPQASMGPPHMPQAALMHNMQQHQQAAAMHMYQQQQLFMMHQQHAAMHGMGEQPYRVDPPGQLPLGARRLQEAVKQQEKQRRQEARQNQRRRQR